MSQADGDSGFRTHTGDVRNKMCRRMERKHGCHFHIVLLQKSGCTDERLKELKMKWRRQESDKGK